VEKPHRGAGHARNRSEGTEEVESPRSDVSSPREFTSVVERNARGGSPARPLGASVEDSDAKSMGFEIDHETHVKETLSTDPYEEVRFGGQYDRNSKGSPRGSVSSVPRIRVHSPDSDDENETQKDQKKNAADADSTDDDTDEDYSPTPEREQSPPVTPKVTTPPAILIKTEDIRIDDEPVWDTVPATSAIDYHHEMTTKF